MSEESQKFVVISDVHVHPRSLFAEGEGIHNSRMQQTLSVLDDSLSYAQSHDAVWLCAGDLFHTTGHARNTVLNAVYDALSRYEDLVDMYIIWGNHDSRGSGYAEVTENETALSSLSSAIDSLHLLNKDLVEIREGLTLYGAGAQANEKHLDYGPGGTIGMFHGIVDGTETPSGNTLDGEIDPFDLVEKYSLSVVGDVHHPQARYVTTHEGDQERTILVPGAPEHHNFGDKGERGWWTFEVEKHDLKFEEGHEWLPVGLEMHESNSPKFVTVDSQDEVKDDGNFYRVMGEVDHDTLPVDVKAIGSKPTTVENRDSIPLGADETEVLTAWMEETPPPEELDREKILKIGRQLLDDADLTNLKDMRLIRVQGEDFFSYKEFDYAVDEGVTLVTGRSNDFDSNGAGKTTLFEAIYWALFGRTTKGTAASDVIRWGADECAVELHFVIDEDTTAYIRRERDQHSIHVEAAIDGEPVRGETNVATEKRFLRHIGLTEDIFRALAYKSQKDVLLLTQATDAERKDVLAELCGLSAYQEASSEAGSLSREKEDEVKSARDKLDTLSDSMESLESRIDEVEKKAEEWEEDHEQAIEEAEEELQEAEDHLRRRSTELEARYERIEDRAGDLLETWNERHEARIPEWKKQFAKRQREKLESRLKDRREERSDLDLSEEPVVLADIKEELEEELEELREAKSAANDEFIEARANRRRANEDYEEIEGEVEDLLVALNQQAGGTCPECGQEITEDHLKDLIDEKREEKKEAADKLNEVLDHEEKAKERLDNIQEDINSVKEDLELAEIGEDIRERAAELDEQIEEIESDLEDVENQAQRQAEKECRTAKENTQNRLAGLLARAKRYVNSRISSLEQDVEDCEIELKRLKSQDNPHIDTLETLGEEYDDVLQRAADQKSRRDRAKRERKVYEYWSHGFSKQGLQSLLLEEVAAEFNNVRQEIFPLLTRSTYDVQFSTISETQEGEKREKTEFVIRYGDREVDYDQLSGGQQRRIDVGVMLAITIANARMRGVPGVLGILILDEVFDFLDDDGKEAVAETLQGITDIIPAAYVVTQDNDMKSHFTQVMQVEQDENGISRIASGG